MASPIDIGSISFHPSIRNQIVGIPVIINIIINYANLQPLAERDWLTRAIKHVVFLAKQYQIPFQPLVKVDGQQRL